ncbi:hypothetical protein J7413_11885 [Shimia sp. R10_1]|uniref:hypothetical protein n=1 Tax=Shimia sp. R10_1 TaxID=2821095 RepID=UPI001AD9A06C|nr:hypothetical protein [Shimia sp. R10_1]MBO9474241.1 hypothetical protein [Shimia sp. R10_1]
MADDPTKQLAARVICDRAGYDFSEVFKYQFVLSKAPVATSFRWRNAKLGEWYLQACPDLRVTPIYDTQNEHVGWFLGVGILEDGTAVKDRLTVPNSATDARLIASLRTLIFKTAGRFAVLLCKEGVEQIHFDAALDQSVVYNPAEGLVASSTMLAAYGEHQHNPRFNGKTILRRNLCYAFEHTSDRRVLRAFPNHFLDLGSFELQRLWPGTDAEFDVSRAERPGLIAQMEDRLRQVMSGLLTNFDCCLPVSGGYDSRLLLSYGKEEIRHLKSAFTHAINHNTLADCLIARNLCQQLGVPHHIINTLDPEHEPVLRKPINRIRFDEFALRTGYESGTRDPRAGLANTLAPEHEVLIRGNLVGILSAQQYLREYIDAPFDMGYALYRLRISEDWTPDQKAFWSARYRDWMNTLPEAAHARIYDMAFLELVQPHALGAHLNGSTNAYHVNPFNDRILLHGSMRLRPRFRVERNAIDRMQQRAAPEFSSIPHTTKVKRLISDALGKAPPLEDVLKLDIVT